MPWPVMLLRRALRHPASSKVYKQVIELLLTQGYDLEKATSELIEQNDNLAPEVIDYFKNLIQMARIKKAKSFGMAIFEIFKHRGGFPRGTVELTSQYYTQPKTSAFNKALVGYEIHQHQLLFNQNLLDSLSVHLKTTSGILPSHETTQTISDLVAEYSGKGRVMLKPVT